MAFRVGRRSSLGTATARAGPGIEALDVLDRAAENPAGQRRPKAFAPSVDGRTREVEPRGPYSLAFLKPLRLSNDQPLPSATELHRLCSTSMATRTRRAWQALISGTVTITAAESTTVAERMRWILALDDDHSDFLRSVHEQPHPRRTSRALRGLRPLRVGTVAQALLRAFCGQLIEAKRARRLEQTIIRAICAEGPERLHVAPATADLAALAPSQLRALGLHAGRGAHSSGSAARSTERLHDVETRVVGGPADASAVSGRGRSASSASKDSAGTTTDSSEISASSSFYARSVDARSRAGKQRSSSSRTASGRASRACICSRAIRAVCSPRNLCTWSASRSSAAAASAKHCSRAC